MDWWKCASFFFSRFCCYFNLSSFSPRTHSIESSFALVNAPVFLTFMFIILFRMHNFPFFYFINQWRFVVMFKTQRSLFVCSRRRNSLKSISFKPLICYVRCLYLILSFSVRLRVEVLFCHSSTLLLTSVSEIRQNTKRNNDDDEENQAAAAEKLFSFLCLPQRSSLLNYHTIYPAIHSI